MTNKSITKNFNTTLNISATTFPATTLNYNYNDVLEEHKFVDHKTMSNNIVLKLRDTGFTKQSERTCNCADYLEFSLKQHVETSERKKKLVNANFCKFRFCPMCNWRRTRNVTGQLKEAFEKIEEDRDIGFIFLTLTVKNPSMSQLKETVQKMNESFRRMVKTKAYMKAVLGHFKALEVLGDKTKEGEAHPHFHVLLIVRKSYFKSRDYINKKEWTEMWKKALRDNYTPVVDVRRIKAKVDKSGRKWTDTDAAIYEVAKYSVKHTELVKLSDDDFTDMLLQTQRMRFYSTGGILKEKINLLKVDEDLINLKEQAEVLWIEIVRLLYKFQEGDYYLKDVKPPKPKDKSPP